MAEPTSVACRHCWAKPGEDDWRDYNPPAELLPASDDTPAAVPATASAAASRLTEM